MKKIYKTPSILLLDVENEYGYCQVTIAGSGQKAQKDLQDTSTDSDPSYGLVKTITMDYPSDDDW